MLSFVSQVRSSEKPEVIMSNVSGIDLCYRDARFFRFRFLEARIFLVELERIVLSQRILICLEGLRSNQLEVYISNKSYGKKKNGKIHDKKLYSFLPFQNPLMD